MSPTLFWISVPAVGACVHLFPSGPPFLDSLLIGWMIHTTGNGDIPLAQKALNWKPVAAVGMMSYSLYVWQMPLCGLPHNTILQMAAVLSLLGSFTILSYTYIEMPAKKLGLWLLARRYETTRFVVPASSELLTP
jgi:peptidoglycan/LPS O-acetylase OafA/YrhL